MPNLLQQLWSPMERALGAAAEAVDAVRDDDIGLGCESAYPWLQFEGWQPVGAQGAPSTGAAD